MRSQKSFKYMKHIDKIMSIALNIVRSKAESYILSRDYSLSSIFSYTIS